MPDFQDGSDPAAFAALKQPAVDALARILYLKRATSASAPSQTDAACASWLRRQKRTVAGVHDLSLRRPRTLSLLGDLFSCRRRSSALAETHEMLHAEAAAALCPSHKRLNPRVLAALLALVADESTRRLERVREAACGGDDAAVAFWLRSAERIPALWMGRRRWEDAARRPLDVRLPACARRRCAACRLAVVGGSPQFLMDLRTGLLARWEKRRPPLLLRMVEAWIDACYARRRRRHIRRESELMAGAVRRVLRRGGSGMKRRYVRRGWLAAPVILEADVEEMLGSEEEDGDDGEQREYVEEEYAQGRWRWCRRRPEREGYSQYLPPDAFAVPGTSTRRRPGEYGKPAPPPPPPPPPPRHRSASRTRNTDRTATTPPRAAAAAAASSSSPPPPCAAYVHVHDEDDLAEPPWATTDYDPPAPHKPWPTTPPTGSPDADGHILGSRAEAELAAIYDAYRAATTSSPRNPSSLFTRASPSSACSPVDDTGPQMKDGEGASPLQPPPLRTRPRSCIPVPTRAAGRPPAAAARESVHSVTSTVLLGLGRYRREREG